MEANVKVRQPNSKLIVETWFVLVKMVISRFVFSICSTLEEHGDKSDSDNSNF